MGSTETPYGAWVSPIDAALLTAGQVGLSEPIVDGGHLYWLESRADQEGRVSLWHAYADGAPTEITPHHCVRTAVHEYGGGAFDANDGVVVFSNFPDQVVYRIAADGPVALTDGTHRYAALRVYPDFDVLLAVREDHSAGGEPIASIVALRLSDGRETVLVQGADFYDSPCLGPDGRIGWVEWDHPNMPWDTTCIRAGRLVGDDITDVVTVAYAEDVAAVRPAWFPDGRLCFLTDESGFWNFAAFDGESVTPLHFHPFDFEWPAWQLGRGSYALLDDDRVLCTWFERGQSQLGILTQGRLERLGTDQVTVFAVAASAQRTVALVGYADRPRALVDVEHAIEVRTSATLEIDPAYLSLAQPLSVGMPPVHAWYYPPTNPDHHAPDGELPPLRVLSHGGPTSFSPPALRLEYQYWTSRGYAIADVNYGGSTAYGRAYRDRLKQGQWGIVDVADCVIVAQELAARGLVDPARTYIEGGSAGGYTTLRALTTTDVFAAGICYYGISDLALLARDTHKFESRYLDELIGRWPADEAHYEERSPLHQLDSLSAPMLILQGTEDKVVPLRQAEDMAAAVRAKGLPAGLLVFAGEGHGFRRAESIRRSLEASQWFLGTVFGFTPADEVEPVDLG